MKLFIPILVFLIVSTIKQKEACKDSSNAPVKISLFSGSGDSSNKLANEKNKKVRSYGKLPPHGPNGVPDTENAWWKDHEVLLPDEPVEQKWRPKRDLIKIVKALQKKVDKFQATDVECPNKMTYAEYYKNLNRKEMETKDNWQTFFAEISNCEMYPMESDAKDNLVKEMKTLDIDEVRDVMKGTQLILKLRFSNGHQAAFKPMRFGPDYEKDPNLYYSYDVERPNAEIAAYHLDRLLGFRRAVPTVGRVLSIRKDLMRYTVVDKIKYFESPKKYFEPATSTETGKPRIRMQDSAKLYSGRAHPICGDPDEIKGSLQPWIPSDKKDAPGEINFKHKSEKSPYIRGKDKDTVPWQRDHKHCNREVKNMPEFREGRRLLDLVELSILDFITGNQDRWGYDQFSIFDQNPDISVTFMLALDNGKGFGSPHDDDSDILAPLTQCCVVRPSTVKTLLSFFFDEMPLSQKLEESLQDDQIGTVLSKKYLNAVDRRVGAVLRAVAKCVKEAKGDLTKVLMNYYSFTLDPRVIKKRRRMASRSLRTKEKDEESELSASVPETTLRKRTHRVRLVRNIIDAEPPPPKPDIDNNLVGLLRNTWKVQNFQETDPECPGEKTYEQYHEIESSPETSHWRRFFLQISNCHMYPEDSQFIQTLIDDMGTTRSITEVDAFKSEAQMKLILNFDNENQGIFKPMRFTRYYESNLNQFYMDDFERANAEIAAFHLDRLLGFRRALPTVGRVLHIGLDMAEGGYNNIAYFRPPHSNRCFYPFTDCEQYCDQMHAICGNEDDLVQGSIQAHLGRYETLDGFERKTHESPYRKIFSKEDFTLTSNQTDYGFCDSTLKHMESYNNGLRLLDLINLYIFDYLTGNQERDKYETFKVSPEDPDGFIATVENGKAFGSPHIDDMKILAPLTQCCIVRPSTVKTLLNFYDGDTWLGKALYDSLQQDPIDPILAQKYLVAVDRRVGKVLQAVADCIENAGGDLAKVLMNRFPPNQDVEK